MDKTQAADDARNRMNDRNNDQRPGPTIRSLYPTLTEAELKEAEANLCRYFEIALQIQQKHYSAGVDFDTASDPPTMEERSNAHLKS